MHRIVLVSAALAAAALVLATGAAAGVTEPSIYVNGQLYRTVVTPTDFSHTGAPLHSYETIYALPGAAHNVAVAAPGDPGYRGGRWQVHLIAFNTSLAATIAAHDMNGSGDLDTAAEVEAALADPGPGGATDTGVIAQFECPVIPVPHGRR